MTMATPKRIGPVALLVAASLLLAGCLFAPGKFTATLDIRKDGSFRYAYTGQVLVLGLTRLARMGQEASSAPFTAKPCLTDDEPAKPRPCTSRELDEQRLKWRQEHASSPEKSARDAQAMRMLFGGLDLADPRSAEELAARLRKQAGWRSVVYKGDGLYEVDFAIAGRLDRDFAFPTVERVAMANPFLTLSRRQDGTVRLDAPGFTGAAGGGPLAAMMANAPSAAGASPSPPWPQPEGRFTLTTDAPLLANNTEDGPQPDAAGQRLQWTIDARSNAAPMAIVRLEP